MHILCAQTGIQLTANHGVGAAAGAGEVLAVVTLATPHVRSPAHLQPSLAAQYRQLAAQPALEVPLLSIAGGSGDVQVPSGLALLPHNAALLATHVDMRQLAGVWVSADHKVSQRASTPFRKS